MDNSKYIQRQKVGVRPHQIIFERENTENRYINFTDKTKPRIRLNDGITQEEYNVLSARREEMTALAEEIIWQNYLNPNSDLLMSEVDSFPDIRYLTGNYYVSDVSYGYIYRDGNFNPYRIKDGQFRRKFHNGKEWVTEYLPLDSQKITRYYHILLSLHLTGDGYGEERDYMSLDLAAELKSLDDPIEFEILSHDVI